MYRQARDKDANNWKIKQEAGERYDLNEGRDSVGFGMIHVQTL